MNDEQKIKALFALQLVFKNVIIAGASVTRNIIYSPSEKKFTLDTNQRVLDMGTKLLQCLKTNTMLLNEFLTECIDIQKSIDEYLKTTTLTTQTRSICRLLHASAEILISILVIPTQTNQSVS